MIALAMGFAPLQAQSSTSPTAGPAGCYAVTLGPWSRPFGDSVFHKVPRLVSLDSASTDRGDRQLRPNMPYPRGYYFPGTPRWRVNGDTIELVWSNGFTPTVVKLQQTADGTLRGRAVALSDDHPAGEPPPPEANVTARRASCPPAFDEASAHAMIRVTPGLDSAATERWVLNQQRSCNGRFFRVFNEIMILAPRGDSTPAFRYARVLDGVQCVPKK